MIERLRREEWSHTFKAAGLQDIVLCLWFWCVFILHTAFGSGHLKNICMKSFSTCSVKGLSSGLLETFAPPPATPKLLTASFSSFCSLCLSLPVCVSFVTRKSHSRVSWRNFWNWLKATIPPLSRTVSNRQEENGKLAAHTFKERVFWKLGGAA